MNWAGGAFTGSNDEEVTLIILTEKTIKSYLWKKERKNYYYLRSETVKKHGCTRKDFII